MDRPRRSTRAPARLSQRSSPPLATPSAPSKAAKKKAKDFEPDDPQSFFNYLVANPKSLLTRMDTSEVMNNAAWDMLPEQDRAELSALLPPTAFVDFKPYLDAFHPSLCPPTHEKVFQEEIAPSQDTSEPEPMDVDPDVSIPSSSQPPLKRQPNTSIFTDSHFLAAAHTWQDHIYSKWTTEAHAEKVTKYLEGVQNGSLAAPWKDEVWAQDNQHVKDEEAAKSSGTRGKGKAKLAADSSLHAIAGEAREVRLPTLVRAKVFRAGDIIAYKRHFAQANVTVEKDVIIESIDKSHGLNVLFEPGLTQYLPLHLLLPNPGEPDPSSSTLSSTIMTPTMLETALLDTDGRVDKCKRANSNAWKHFTVYRWRGENVGDLEDGRGGRENHGTMFYLRGTYWHER